MNVLVLLLVLFIGFLLAAVLLFRVILPLLALLVAVVTFVLYLGSILWAFFDANARGKPGWAVALLAAIGFWPIGLLAWFIFRPEKKSGRVNTGPAVLPSASAPPPF